MPERDLTPEEFEQGLAHLERERDDAEERDRRIQAAMELIVRNCTRAEKLRFGARLLEGG